MPDSLSELERRVLDYLVEYLRTNTYQPSIREIGREFAIKSTKTVSELLQSLADKGWIERDPSRSRGVKLLGVEMGSGTISVPYLENAGESPQPARLELDRKLVGAHAFVVTMQSNHLAEESIRPGDLLLIEKVDLDALEMGDLLLVRIGADSSIRRCVRRGAELVLDAVRAEELPLTLTAQQAASVVLGRVTTVVRRLQRTVQHAPRATSPQPG